MRPPFPLILLISLATILAVDLMRSAAGTNDPQPRPATWAVKLRQTDLPNLYRVTTNLYRGAQPNGRGMKELKAMGIRTVINLRGYHSDNDEVLGTGMKQGRLHMEPWRADDADVVGFLKLATDTNNLPVFVHCQRGADRTGMVCAMYRITVCGWTKEEAIRELKDGGFGFNPAWKNIVRYIEKADIEKIKKKAGLVEPLKR
jgi:protein tyrosine/serine phosphatase